MTEKKKFVGIQENELRAIGTVIEDPQIVPDGDGECAFINLECITAELGANGQWVETPIIIPFICRDQGKVKTIRNYVKTGRELLLKGYYKSWQAGGETKHGFIMTFMRLGRSPYVPKEENAEAAAPLPPV